MNIHIHILDGGNKLTQVKENIRTIAESTVSIVAGSIPVDNVDIVIYPDSIGTIKYIGLGGFIKTEHLVLIPIDPGFPDLKTSLKEQLPGTLAHELYHCLRNFTPSRKYTLLDALINEGLADHFALEMTKSKPEKWDTALSEAQYSDLYQRAEADFYTLDTDRRAWFFGSKKANIPRWTGYTIGFRIVGEYLKKHPDKKPSQLFTLTSKECI